jgi:metal-responsive CopG/Arc/MetJ family transcriptional regulator
MATSVHIPKPLLQAVDRRARALKMSRNRLIIQALERELTAGVDWPVGFFEKLGVPDAELAEAVDEMTEAIQANRRSKGPARF